MGVVGGVVLTAVLGALILWLIAGILRQSYH